MVFFLFQLAFTCRKVTDEGAEKEFFGGGGLAPRAVQNALKRVTQTSIGLQHKLPTYAKASAFEKLYEGAKKF